MHCRNLTTSLPLSLDSPQMRSTNTIGTSSILKPLLCARIRISIWKAYPLLVTQPSRLSITSRLYMRNEPVRSENWVQKIQLARKLAHLLMSFRVMGQPFTPPPSPYLVPVTMSAPVCFCFQTKLFMKQGRCERSASIMITNLPLQCRSPSMYAVPSPSFAFRLATFTANQGLCRVRWALIESTRSAVPSGELSSTTIISRSWVSQCRRYSRIGMFLYSWQVGTTTDIIINAICQWDKSLHNKQFQVRFSNQLLTFEWLIKFTGYPPNCFNIYDCEIIEFSNNMHNNNLNQASDNKGLRMVFVGKKQSNYSGLQKYENEFS